MSCRRPSNTSSSGTGPSLPVTGIVASTSTIGSRRRAAAMASPSRVCAFSRASSLSSSACQAAPVVTAGRAVFSGSLVMFASIASAYRVRRRVPAELIAGSAAYEGGKVTEDDEGAVMVDHGLHVLAYVLDDFGPGTGDLVLVKAGPAGPVIRDYRGV